MNSKIVLAFLGGAVLASGIVYMAVKPDSKAVGKPLYVQSVQPAPQSAQPAQPAPVPAETAPALEQKSPVVSAESKPAPVERRPRHETQHHATPPVQVAQAAAPAANPPTPAVVPAPPLPVMPPPSNNEASNAPAPPPPAPEPPKAPLQPHVVTLAAGTPLSVRIGETLSTKRNKPGDTFLATLAEPLTVEDFVIAERGSRCEGRVTEADPGGRVKGTARLGIELTSCHLSDGQRIKLHTQSFAKDAPTSHREDMAKMGGGAALGAIIGAIAGGGKGAGIGAAAGGAAGAGDVALTRGKPAEIPVETRVSFRVQEPVTITERLQ